MSLRLSASVQLFFKATKLNGSSNEKGNGRRGGVESLSERKARLAVKMTSRCLRSNQGHKATVVRLGRKILHGYS